MEAIISIPVGFRHQSDSHVTTRGAEDVQLGACAGYRVFDVIKERYGTVLPLFSSVRS
jgi:hypothetical protein